MLEAVGSRLPDRRQDIDRSNDDGLPIVDNVAAAAAAAPPIVHFVICHCIRLASGRRRPTARPAAQAAATGPASPPQRRSFRYVRTSALYDRTRPAVGTFYLAVIARSPSRWVHGLEGRQRPLPDLDGPTGKWSCERALLVNYCKCACAPLDLTDQLDPNFSIFSVLRDGGLQGCMCGLWITRSCSVLPVMQVVVLWIQCSYPDGCVQRLQTLETRQSCTAGHAAFIGWLQY